MSDPELHPEQPPVHVAMQAASAVSTFVGHRGTVASVLSSPLYPESPARAHRDSPQVPQLSGGTRPSPQAPAAFCLLRDHRQSQEPDGEFGRSRISQYIVHHTSYTIYRRQRAEVLVFISVGHLCKMADEAMHQTMMGTGEPEDKSQNQWPVQ